MAAGDPRRSHWLGYGRPEPRASAGERLYRVTLDRPGEVRRIPFPRRVRERLPEILSVAEVERLLGAVRRPKHCAMLMVAYGAGLRVSELCALIPTDIDSQRMLVRVRAGKGDKDRYVMLSPRLLATLRAYWRLRPPRGPYLFPSPRPGKALSRMAVFHVVRRAARPAGGGAHRLTPASIESTIAETGRSMGTATASHASGSSSVAN